ncbi:hypothetical protein BT93_B0008 [Corymbia citriodora subsp. variegata]|nr:hypothetical protein BT93_B0008 [Corymbia citriodora subsp. variegata]
MERSFMGFRNYLSSFCFGFAWSLLIVHTHQLQSSQSQVLLQLRKQLEYPPQLEIWNVHGVDFCSLPPSPTVNLTCENNFVTELKLAGEKVLKGGYFEGFAVPNKSLSQNFSMDSFVSTLARLTSLKVLHLVSLGMWGPLPDKIHRLSSLEHLDFSSNFLYGSVPPRISAMVMLQTLVLDDNFFNGTVPNWFDALKNLTVLSLRNNRLRGEFPSSVKSVNTLSEVILSGNEIDGKLPDLSGLRNLHVLNLSGNKLSSGLPALPKGLVMAFLNNNSFSGQVPKEYSQLNDLQYLDVSFNSLRGVPPSALFSLPNISYLSFASNMMSGSLPHDVDCSSKLGFVDLSNNRLRGSLPTCLNSKSGDLIVHSGGNCLSVDSQHQHAESYCLEIREAKQSGSGGKNVGVMVGVIGGGVAALVLLASVFLILFTRYCCQGMSEQHLLHKQGLDNSDARFSSEILTSARYISEAAKINAQSLPPCRSFSFEELKVASNNFDEASLLGEGSYGKLYRGRLDNGMQVTIRCLPSRKYSIRNLRLRLDLLAKLRHPHLACLLGHCIDGGVRDDPRIDKVFLIYEYVPNGNFQARLSGNNPAKVLSWSKRLAVLIGVARAVHFLHTGIIPGFFNNRLKTNNILLNEHGMAKLSDYGLSVISGEIDQDVGEGESPRSRQRRIFEDDAYSFGFIIMESFVGPSIARRREAFLLNEMASLNSQDGWQHIVDPFILTTSSRESLSIVISIAKKCMSFDGSRPSFEDILWNLEYAAQVQATADAEQK